MTRKRGTMVRTIVMPEDRQPAYRYALAWAGTTAYVICSEGVGWRVADDAPLTVDGYVKTDDGLAVTSWDMSLAEVLTASVTGDDVDLADFVRTFGSRLDSNVYMWQARLGA